MRVIIVLSILSATLLGCASPTMHVQPTTTLTPIFLLQAITPAKIYAPGDCIASGQPVAAPQGAMLLGANIRWTPLPYDGKPFECQVDFTIYQGIVTLVINGSNPSTQMRLILQWMSALQGGEAQTCIDQISVIDGDSTFPEATITLPSGSWKTIQSTPDVAINQAKHMMTINLTKLIKAVNPSGRSSIDLQIGVKAQGLGDLKQCVAAYSNLAYTQN